MIRAGALLGWLGLVLPLSAHPGVGIVRDQSGNVYYTDLSQVWRIPPGGERHVFVPGVHTHELSLDDAGRLYGEHLWYEGEATNKWGHYVWRATPAGDIEKIVPPTEGFLTGYGFARDAADNLYWADRDAPGGPAIKKRSPDGTITTVAQRLSFRDIRWLTCAPDGTVFFIERSDLIRVTTDGAVHVLATRLAESDAPDQRHLVQGLCVGPAGQVFVAVPARRVVKKIAPDGTVSVAADSPPPWSPSGVLVDPDGSLWVLEYSPANEVRVRHHLRDGRVQDY